MTNQAVLELVDRQGTVKGRFIVECLPNAKPWNGLALIEDRRGLVGAGQSSAAPVQVLEETEYHYEVAGCPGPLRIDPTELFSPSSGLGNMGRFRPGRSTGTVVVHVSGADGGDRGSCEIEVRSRKLAYLTEYRWMLERIADEAAEVLQSRFAPAFLRAFRPDPSRTAQTLYQRFALVNSIVSSDEIQDAIGIVLARPHHAYQASERSVDPSCGFPASRHAIQELCAPGPRQPMPASSRLSSVPQRVDVAEHHITRDTLPNQFVRFVLERWRNLGDDMILALATQSGPAAQRGRREAENLRESVELVLAAPLFREVGRLTEGPNANTVLQRRAGYREILRAYYQSEAAAMIEWDGASEVYEAGQRNVATLYEYWVFLELVRIVESCVDLEFDRAPMFRQTRDGIALELQRGREVCLRGTGKRRGRSVSLMLWFNREFASSPFGSWTEPMRPDCSLLIAPTHPDSAGTWLHFDAKYRIKSHTEGFFSPDMNEVGGSDVTDVPTQRSTAVPDDLLKMHAYRDAIRRTSGAYVLYPGEDVSPLKHTEYHEVLPGLGAFVLRPSSSGNAHTESAAALRAFLEDVIDHVAADGTDHQRSTYWTSRTYRERSGKRLDHLLSTALPPADAKVLLGYVRSKAHLDWIKRTGWYNLRADGRSGAVGLDSPALSAELLVTYGPETVGTHLFRLTGQFALKSRQELTGLGYPNPQGSKYCCLEIAPGSMARLVGTEVASIDPLLRDFHPSHPYGAPAVVSWGAFVSHFQATSQMGVDRPLD